MINLLLSNPNSVDVTKVLIAVGIMLVIAIVFGFLIMVVSKKFATETNEREDRILGCLAGANCGGCGKAGCGDFARSLLENKSQINDCAVTSPENKKTIAEVLGVEFSSANSVKYVVACNGGDSAKDENFYVGVSDCVRQASVLGGAKTCNTACLGLGTCVKTCTYGAISVENGKAEILQGVCAKCGACYNACPKQVIKKVSGNAKVYVACSTKCRGKEVIDACKNGCVGCGICAKNCPEGAIKMVNNLPEIDYDKCIGCLSCVSRCPKNVIKKLD